MLHCGIQDTKAKFAVNNRNLKKFKAFVINK